MKTSKTESKQEAQWQTTPVANLVRNTASGIYYARVRLKGKLICKSRPTVLTVVIADAQMLIYRLWNQMEERGFGFRSASATLLGLSRLRDQRGHQAGAVTLQETGPGVTQDRPSENLGIGPTPLLG